MGLRDFQMASKYRISKIEKITNLKNAAVANALNRDSENDVNKLQAVSTYDFLIEERNFLEIWVEQELSKTPRQ